MSDMHIRVVMMCIRAIEIFTVDVYELYPCGRCAHYVRANAQHSRARVGRYVRLCCQRWGVCTTARAPCGCVCWDSFESPDSHVVAMRLLRPRGKQSRHSHYTLNWRGLRSQHSGCMALARCSMCVDTINTRHARNCSYRNHRSTIMIRTRNRNRNCRYDIGFVAEILSISLPVIFVVISACVADGVTDSVFV